MNNNVSWNEMLNELLDRSGQWRGGNGGSGGPKILGSDEEAWQEVLDEVLDRSGQWRGGNGGSGGPKLEDEEKSEEAE